jgi:hypothetical protein
MNLFTRLTRSDGEERAFAPITLDQWANYFSFNGNDYVVQGGTPSSKGEPIEANFQGYVQGAYKSNGVVFACMAARQLLFSEARFQFRQLRGGRPGDLFGSPELAILESPWTNGTTGDLLTRMILDADLAGNFYGVRRGNAIRRLRPDWVTIVLGSSTGSEMDAEIVGYAYNPGGPGSGEDPIYLLPEQVAHFAPYPDPVAKYRGMSWLSPIVEEITADASATTHKRNFFENGAKLGYVVTLDPDGKLNPDAFKNWVETYKAGHEGSWNAYKTLFLAGGADVKTVGADLQQVDFKQVQGAGETRICAAARIPPIIVGVSEGLDSATYSNYGQARRAFADLTMRPMWRNAAHSMASIITVPASSELWYDDRDIPFLQEDVKDNADILATQSSAIATLVTAGFDPDAAVKAITSGDLKGVKHSGLYSVQLQEPGADTPPPPASSNGNGQLSLPAPTP